MQQKIYHAEGQFCLYNATIVENFTPEIFNASYWQAQHAITGSAQGRGTTWFIQPEKQNGHHKSQQEWVLRHYYRGGLIGKFIHDHYCYTSQKNTRAAREFVLLAKMQQLNLPAPKPIAYRIIRKGLLYQADLLSSRIEQAQDIVALLSAGILSDELWFNIGRTIKRFHQQGIYHHDLNAHNILIDKNEQVYLIDFDRGEQRQVSNQSTPKWQLKNMARLLRSFNKELLQLPNFHWHEQDWQQLLNGYEHTD